MVGMAIYFVVGVLTAVLYDLVLHAWDGIKASLPKVSGVVFEFTMSIVYIICWPILAIFTIILIIETICDAVKSKREAQKAVDELNDLFDEVSNIMDRHDLGE